MIYLDIDGVLRDLANAVFKTKAKVWDQEDNNGNGVIEAVNRKPSILIQARKTPYCDPILDFIVEHGMYLYLLSAQPGNWRVNTDRWIEKNIVSYNRYFQKADPRTIYVTKPEQKLRMLNKKKGDVLVEDYPKFDDYSRIILIDYMYNRTVTGMLARVRTPEELIVELEKYV